MTPVFISYRGEDSGAQALLLRDALQLEFGNGSVFLDTSSIVAGTVCPEKVRQALERSHVRPGLRQWRGTKRRGHGRRHTSETRD
jgi:hypothetical protein